MTVGTAERADALVRLVRERSGAVPIFLLADRSIADTLPTEALRIVTGYVRKLEDTPAFVADRVEEARREYLEPPFPPALVECSQRRSRERPSRPAS